MRGLILVSALALARPALAMAPAVTAAGVPPRSTIAAFSAPTQDGFGLNLLTRYSARSSLRSGTRSVENPTHERTTTWRSTLFIDRRIFARTTAILAVPRVRNRSASDTMDETTDGLGDIALYVRHALYQDLPYRPTRELSLLAGIEMPSGSSSLRDSSGSRLPPSQQPGSGTTDFVVGGVAAWKVFPASLFGDVTYKINTGGAYTFGNFLALNAGAAYPLVKTLQCTGEVNAESWARDRSTEAGLPGVLPGGQVDGTGGEALFVTPGLQWRAAAWLTLSFSAQLPVYQNLRGTQLASGVNYNFGLHSRFTGLSR